jgi:hypothetical protein
MKKRKKGKEKKEKLSQSIGFLVLGIYQSKCQRVWPGS